MTTLCCKFDCYGVLHLLVVSVSYNEWGNGGFGRGVFLCENLVRGGGEKKDAATRLHRRSQRLFIGGMSTVKCVQAVTF